MIETQSWLKIEYPVPEPAENPNELLCKAAEIIEKYGWHQGGFRDYETGAVCIFGALNVAYYGEPEPPIVMPKIWHDAVGILIERVQNLGWHDEVASWNDNFETTEDDVLSVLKQDC